MQGQQLRGNGAVHVQNGSRHVVGVILRGQRADLAAEFRPQQDLAEAVGVTRQTIVAIERGDYNPTIKLCVEICKALGKTLDELFWEP